MNYFYVSDKMLNKINEMEGKIIKRVKHFEYSDTLTIVFEDETFIQFLAQYQYECNQIQITVNTSITYENAYSYDLMGKEEYQNLIDSRNAIEKEESLIRKKRLFEQLQKELGEN